MFLYVDEATFLMEGFELSPVAKQMVDLSNQVLQVSG